jgi:hypothetical protein
LWSWSLTLLRAAEYYNLLLNRNLTKGRHNIMLGTILIILVILLLLGALPAWPYSRGWGYSPSGILGLLLVIVVVLALVRVV